MPIQGKLGNILRKKIQTNFMTILQKLFRLNVTKL